MKSKILVLTIVALILISSALSLGIAPAKNNIRFEPNTSKTFTYTIINNEARDLDVQISAKGELAEFIRVPENIIHLDANESEKKFNIDITLLQNLEPGERAGKITITETNPKIVVGEKRVGAMLEVNSLISVVVPYPEKYILVDFQIEATDKDSPIKLITNITNVGTTDIKKLKVKFGIIDDNKTLATSETDYVNLSRAETKSLSATFGSLNLSLGQYSAVAKIYYDNNDASLIRDFKAGDEYISILDYTKYFAQGKLNKFDVEVRNEWNKKIRNAFATIFIDKFKEEIKSIGYDLNPYEKKTIVSYWDTTNIELGRYDSNISLHYANKTTEKQGEVYVVKESELSALLESPSYLKYGGIAILVITILNLILFMIIARRKKSKNKK
jgi:hypothetical protein